MQENLTKIEREASKQHGFLASVEKLAAAVDPTKRAPTTSGISKYAHLAVQTLEDAGYMHVLFQLNVEPDDLLARSEPVGHCQHHLHACNLTCAR